MELNKTYYANTGCQVDSSEMIQGCLMVLINLKLSACFEGDVEETKDAMQILLLMVLQLLLLCKQWVLR